jgi:uncharacterized membrane protein
VEYTLSFGQVIWAIGASMVVLSGLIFLSTRTVTIIGVAMIVLHNSLDNFAAAQMGVFGWTWQIVHEGGVIDFAPNYFYIALYPLVPWVGVMAAGYGFGSLLLKNEQTRRKTLVMLGIGMVAAFVVIRASNLYGDHIPWTVQNNLLFTVFSFIKCEKYPPSLLYLLMTLGPAIAILPFLEKMKGKVGSFFITFGRVPMFYYVLHIYLIHAFAIVAAYFTVHDLHFLFTNAPPGSWPDLFGFRLAIVYLVWVAVVLSLYPACRWFADVKRRRKDVWLSYL